MCSKSRYHSYDIWVITLKIVTRDSRVDAALKLQIPELSIMCT